PVTKVFFTKFPLCRRLQVLTSVRSHHVGWCRSCWRVFFFMIILEKNFSFPQCGFLRRTTCLFLSEFDTLCPGQPCPWAAAAHQSWEEAGPGGLGRRQ
ncbi:hypothetical protein H8957_017189, partial [Semnopithecus entellus]